MARIFTFLRMLPVLAGLGGVASCRDGEEQARSGVLEAGYKFSISDYLKAAGEGRGAVVEAFLNAGMQVDATGPGGESALGQAAGSGQAHVVKLLLKAKAQPDRADRSGLTPLMAAAGVGDAVSVQELRAAGAKCDRLDSRGRTALSIAAGAGQAEVAGLLVADWKGGLGDVLEVACAAGHTGVIDALLKVNPAGTAQPADGTDWARLLRAAAGGGHFPAVRLLASRMPAGTEGDRLRRLVAAETRASGQEAAADFLLDGLKQQMTEAPETASPSAAPGSMAGADKLSGSRGEAATVAPVAPGGAAPLPEAKSVPVTLAGVRPGRLGGSRFPTLDCEAMAAVPEIVAMVAWEPQAWPVILKDVTDGHGSAEILLTGETDRMITLRVGDEIPGTGCVVEKLRRRRLYTDATESVLKNVSELHFRRTSTGEVFKAMADEPVLSNDSSARLRVTGLDREWMASPGDEFRLGSMLLRVTKIASGAMTLENRLTRETTQVPLTRQP